MPPVASRTPSEAAGGLAVLVDRLVDAIDVRESVEPDVAHWEGASLIRELERELARAWGAARRPDVTGPLESGLRS